VRVLGPRRAAGGVYRHPVPLRAFSSSVGGLSLGEDIARRALCARSADLAHVGSQVRGFAPIVDQTRGFSDVASSFLDEAETRDRVIEVLKGFDKIDAGKVTPEAHFINDLGLDSLDAVELVMSIEEEFAIEIPDDQAEKILSVNDAVKFLIAHPHAK